MELRSKEIWATWSRVSCATDARSLEDGYEADRGWDLYSEPVDYGIMSIYSEDTRMEVSPFDSSMSVALWSPSHTPAPQTFRAWGKREQNFVWQTHRKTQRNTWDYSQYSRNNMYNQARADRVKLCVSRFTFLLPMLAELLGQIRKIDSTMERFLSFEANYLMVLFIARLMANYYLVKYTRPVRKRTREIIYRILRLW